MNEMPVCRSLRPSHDEAFEGGEDMSTMNEMDGNTKHEYDRYANEVLQLEWERVETLRRTRLEWVEDSLQQMLCEYDRVQAQQVMAEQGHSMAVTAEDMMTDVVQHVKPTDAELDDAEDHSEDLEHDEWLDDLWSAEELERAEREAEEVRDDH